MNFVQVSQTKQIVADYKKIMKSKYDILCNDFCSKVTNQTQC